MSTVTPLGQLIAEVREQFHAGHRVELSCGDIARRAGGQLTRQRVQQLATEPIRALPSPATVEALARGLAIPESVVLERALLSAGYRPSGVRGPAAADRTTDRSRARNW